MIKMMLKMISFNNETDEMSIELVRCNAQSGDTNYKK